MVKNINKTKTSHYLMSAMIEQARFTTTKTSANFATYTFHTLGCEATLATNTGTLTSTGGVGGAVLASSTAHKRLRDDLPLRFTSYQYLYDGNGNVIATTNKIGDFKSEFIYTPFGSGVKPHGLITNSSSKPEIPCFGFSTKPTDETGLLYYGYRFYDAKLGRWLTRDPIGEKGGDNVYLAMNNNTILFFDGDGRAIACSSILLFSNPITWNPWVATGVIIFIGEIAMIEYIRSGTFNEHWQKMKASCSSCILDGTFVVPKTVTETKTKEATCKPCNPPIGTGSYRNDCVPPSIPHSPCPGDHTHRYVMHQSPPSAGCVFFWNKINVTCVISPAPAEVSIIPATGGGIAF